MVSQNTIRIDVARDFSRYPGGRYYSDGPYNGERFRKEFLVPILKDGRRVQVFLDGTRGYGSSFLEEAFGGLIREHYTYDQLAQSFELISKNPILLAEIHRYIKSAQ